jgi:hypothetical protein
LVEEKELLKFLLVKWVWKGEGIGGGFVKDEGAKWGLEWRWVV